MFFVIQRMFPERRASKIKSEMLGFRLREKAVLDANTGFVAIDGNPSIKFLK